MGPCRKTTALVYFHLLLGLIKSLQEGEREETLYNLTGSHARGRVSSDIFKAAYQLLSEFEGQVSKMRNEKQNLHQNQLILELEQLILFGPRASVSLSLSLHPSQPLSHLPSLPPLSLSLALPLHSIYFPIYLLLNSCFLNFNFPGCISTAFILTIKVHIFTIY